MGALENCQSRNQSEYMAASENPLLVIVTLRAVFRARSSALQGMRPGALPIRDNEQRAISLGYHASLQDSSQGAIFVVVVMVCELGPVVQRIWKSSQRAESLPTGSS